MCRKPHPKFIRETQALGVENICRWQRSGLRSEHSDIESQEGVKEYEIRKRKYTGE